MVVPHVDQNPYCCVQEGRSEPTLHEKAIVSFSPFNINKRPLKQPQLPTAAIPTHKNEVLTVHRSKKRPAIIISTGGGKVPDWLVKDKPKWQTARTILVAPFYGADESGDRSGFNEVFRERVRRCEFPQFHWDILPIPGGTKESILRLDHIQPIGRNENSIAFTDYCLGKDALSLLDEWLQWLIYGSLPEGSTFGYLREELRKIPCQYQSH
ncbi:hypothetical protein LJC22_03410 [Desulfosarcina sp. OttesenSCG-928-G10]|nr:hypothetical protein [Desulfosarcina sp. OttesenSCG-928-G10]